MAADNERVTWLELFFDLIYVAALIQLGDRLADDVSWNGIWRFLGAFAVLWWTWTGTTVFTNRFAVDDVVHRLLTFVQMFAVGTFAVIAAADQDWPRWLPIAYVAARIPLLLMYARARRTSPEARALTSIYIASFGAGALMWLASLLVPTPGRYWVWAFALLGEFVVPLIVNRDDDSGPPIHNEHFQERYALFTIIVLGETFVKTLSEITKIGISVETQVFGGLTFTMLIAIWWTYFDDVADAHIREDSALTSSAPFNRIIWVYTHLPLAAAVTAFGVASKKVVGTEEFGGELKESYTWLLFAALACILVSVAMLDLVTKSPHYAVEAEARVGPRLVAAVALLPVAWLTANGTFTALVGICIIAAVVVAQIAVEVGVALKGEQRIDRQVREDLADLTGTCEHLAAAATQAIPADAACEPCRVKGEHWVQLRLCLSCGYIGCCDDTPGRHAASHNEETGHPVIITIEAGDEWAYCYEHDLVDMDWQQRRAANQG